MKPFSRAFPESWKYAVKRRSVRLTKRWVDEKLDGRFGYGQEGEDLVAARFLGVELNPRRGFYVDVGAHHPTWLSNTMYFYERGWRGINIDAAPGSMAAFKERRPRDINLELAISNKPGTLTFEEFGNSALSGISSALTEQRKVVPGVSVVATHQVRAETLAITLDEHCPRETQIDLLSVDVEGHDFEVLQSNDWARYRPTLVLVEDVEAGTLVECLNSPLVKYMEAQGYVPVGKTALTIFLAEAKTITRDTCGIWLR